MHSQPWLTALRILAFAFLLPCTLPASALPPAQSEVWLSCALGTGSPWYNYTDVAAAASVTNSCDASFSFDNLVGNVLVHYWGWSVGTGYTTLNTGVEQVDISGSSDYNCCGADFEGGGWAEYYMEVGQLGAPAGTLPDGNIPVTMSASGDAWTSTPGGLAQAGVTISLQYLGGTYYPVPVTGQKLELTPGSIYSVWLSAICSESGPGECQAVTDPTFEFDQATFDTEMGTNTFPLANYYDFEYSPNLTPEPSSAVLIAAGMLGLGYAVRRKQAARGR